MMKHRIENRARLTRLATPQVERNRGTWLLARASDLPNWPADEWERLDRFLIFGGQAGTRALQGCIDTDGPRERTQRVALILCAAACKLGLKIPSEAQGSSVVVQRAIDKG